LEKRAKDSGGSEGFNRNNSKTKDLKTKRAGGGARPPGKNKDTILRGGGKKAEKNLLKGEGT